MERREGGERKRSAAQDHDAELDQGRVKKVKRYRNEEERGWGGPNLFQVGMGRIVISRNPFHVL